MKLCPYCQSPTTKAGISKSGYQKYCCTVCKKHCSDSPNRQPSKPIGAAPMDHTERIERMSAEAKLRRKTRQVERQRERRAEKQKKLTKIMKTPQDYAKDLTKIYDLTEELVSLVKDECRYKLENVLTSYCDLFDRFCPYKIGDQIVLKVTPEISNTVAPGWLPSKHFLIAGAIGIVRSVEYRNNKFVVWVTFESQSWLFQGQVNPSPHEYLYHFTEDQIAN